MARKKYTAEQIIAKLREAEVGLAKGLKTPQVCKQLGISDQTYYRWRREYGGLRVDQAKRLKQLAQENSRLKRVVADLTVLCNGNVLVEGLPGLAKTRTVKSLAKNPESDINRTQFTPDLLPADITGSEV